VNKYLVSVTSMNKLTFSKPDFWFLYSKISTSTWILFASSGFFGIFLGFFLSSRTNLPFWIGPIICLILGLILLSYWIYKTISSNDYLKIDQEGIEFKTYNQVIRLKYNDIEKLFFAQRSVQSNRPIRRYDLKIVMKEKVRILQVDIDKTFYIPTKIANFWTFPTMYVQINEFIKVNQIPLQVETNFKIHNLTFWHKLIKIFFIPFTILILFFITALWFALIDNKI
jgi:hypothetical protein